LSRRFPAERYARVVITLRDGRSFASGDCVARGSADNPLSDDELRAKYDAYAGPVLGAERTASIERMVDALAGDRPVLADLVLQLGKHANES